MPKLLVACAVACLASAAHAEAGSGTASFVALGPAGLHIEGATDQVTLAGAPDQLVVTVDLASLKTGIGVRDKHLHEDLQVDQFPSAQLVVQRKDLKLAEPLSDLDAEADGVLTLHGQSRPMHFTYHLKRGADGIEVRGSLRIHLSDFGIEPRKYLGITVKPDVDASVVLRVAP